MMLVSQISYYYYDYDLAEICSWVEIGIAIHEKEAWTVTRKIQKMKHWNPYLQSL